MAVADAGTGRFPPEARLRQAAAFRRVFDGPQKSVDSCFVVLTCVSLGGQARLGLALSKRHLRRSVDRSRLKRLIRESFRRARCRLPAVDIVILARAGLARRLNQEIFTSLDRHWDRVTARYSSHASD